jgi:hypothetical protein
MYIGTKVTEIDYEGKLGANPYWVFYFIIFIVIGSFFLLNLFVGVVHSSYKRETDQLGGYNSMTDSQRELVDIHLMVLRSKPIVYPKSGNIIYRFCQYIINDTKWFEILI